MPRKVAHLTTAHPPYDIRIFHKQCRTLAAVGYEVVLVAPHERDLELEENGVRVRAVSAPKSRLDRLTRTLWEVYRVALKEDAQVYHFHDPELIPIGLLLKMKGKRVIYDVHEDLPKQVLTKYWIPAGLRPLVSGLVAVVEQLGALVFDRVVAATPSISSHFPVGRVRVVQNFPELANLSVGRVRYSERQPVIAYIGGLTHSQGARQMVDAMALLPESPEVRLVLAGRFDPRAYEADIRALPGWARVDYVGWQSRKGISEILGRARIGLVVDHPIPNYVEGYSTKMFEYMAAGIPVVASNFPLWCQIVGEAQCGILVDPFDIRAIADAVLWLLAHPVEAEAMGQRGRKAVCTRYNWGHESKILLECYDEVLRQTVAKR